MNNKEISDHGNKISLGKKVATLTILRSKMITQVFAASNKPAVIYSSNKNLVYSNVNLEDVNHMHSFNSVSFPRSVAILKKDMLTIGSIVDIQLFHIPQYLLGNILIILSSRCASNICHVL